MKKRDFILIGVILAVAISTFVGIKLFQEEGDYVVVTVGEGTNRHEIARFNLSEDGEYTLNGGTNILKIEGGKAWMIYGDCPKIKGDCTRQGKISKDGQEIVCTVNDLIVTVHKLNTDDSGEETDPEIAVGQ